MLYDEKQLPELRHLKHLHDDVNENFNYERSILEKSLSPYIYENAIMANFLYRLQPVLALFFDQYNIIKNWKNYIVDKYYYKHRG